MQSNYMGKKAVYGVLGLLSFSFRLFLEFQSSIITGINGGYYPVQVRHVLEHGHLAMKDMPLVFYVNAFFVKVFAFILPSQPIDFIIILVTKILGALSIPLLVFPLYKLIHHYLAYKLTKPFEYLILGFALFSFSSLYLGAEMMKNAYALVGFTYFIYFIIRFFKEKSNKYVLLSVFTLLLIGVTHFGVFAIALIFLLLFLICVYRVRAVVPILITSVIGFLIVWWLDPFRAFNAINIFEKWFGLPWRIAFYPAGIASFILSVFVVLILFLTIRNKKVETSQKQMFTVFMWFIALLSIPLLRFELWRRFNLMLFIPQLIALVLVFPYLKASYKKKFTVLLSVIIGVSVIFNLVFPKTNSISLDAYNDLSEMSNKILNPNETIIIVRHGLDWWVVWQLKTKMAQSHIKINDTIASKYDDILFLKQNKGHNDLYPGPGSPFFNPSIPENSILLYASDYFDLYKWSEK
jgi:hypothetical protein